MKAIVKFKGKICSGGGEYKFIGIQESLDGSNQVVGLNVLLSSTSIDFETSHDVWVENYMALIEYFKETGFVVHWL